MPPPNAPLSGLIHVARQGVVLGKFTLAELLMRLGSGEVLRSDHYWKVGLPGWAVIGSTFDAQLPAPPVSATPYPAAAPAAVPAPRASSRAPLLWFGGVLALFLLLQGHAYFTLKAPLAKALRSDARNEGIVVSAYYRYHVPAGSIVFDVESIGPETRPIDMMRVLLQFAETQQASRYEWVVLASRGQEKFKMKGTYFQRLGREYGSENPMYTMRTLPENLQRLDGRRAFPVWEGGALGVMAEQMKNFSEFTVEWLR
jgi:hypothetical protein